MNKYPYPRAVSWLLFENVSKSHSLLIYNVVTGFEYELSEEQAHLLLIKHIKIKLMKFFIIYKSVDLRLKCSIRFEIK